MRGSRIPLVCARSTDDSRCRRSRTALLGWHDVRISHAAALDAQSRRDTSRADRVPRRCRRKSLTERRTGAPWGVSESAYARSRFSRKRTNINRSEFPVSVSNGGSRTTSSSRPTPRCWRCRSARTRSFEIWQSWQSFGLLGPVRDVRVHRLRSCPSARGGACPTRSCARTWHTIKACCWWSHQQPT